MFCIYGISWGTSLALCVLGFLKLMSILLEIHGIIGQLLPRKSSTASDTSVAVETSTDVESQRDAQPDSQGSTTMNQQVSGEFDYQGVIFDRSTEDEPSQPEINFKHLAEDDSNSLSAPQYATNRKSQDVESAGEGSGKRSTSHTPPSTNDSEAGDLHTTPLSSINVLSDTSSDWEDISEDADDMPEMYAAFARRLDAELNDVDWETHKLNF
ncbi:hypothetical protein MMC18_003890 [Xylographa bjoerkii]|nr:hypothetical protein [Xylographa bjoerkii]